MFPIIDFDFHAHSHAMGTIDFIIQTLTVFRSLLPPCWKALYDLTPGNFMFCVRRRGHAKHRVRTDVPIGEPFQLTTILSFVLSCSAPSVCSAIMLNLSQDLGLFH
jgi:hypothetical protein